MAKSRDAFRTISEVAEWLDTPAHVLRFWESKFSQVKPVKRAGGRRYYRPSDMELLGGIKKLLHEDGMTIKGVQKVLRERGVRHVAGLSPLDLQEDAAQVVEDAPYVDIAEGGPDDTVVAFNRDAVTPQVDLESVEEAERAEPADVAATETVGPEAQAPAPDEMADDDAIIADEPDAPGPDRATVGPEQTEDAAGHADHSAAAAAEDDPPPQGDTADVQGMPDQRPVDAPADAPAAEDSRDDRDALVPEAPEPAMHATESEDAADVGDQDGAMAPDPGLASPVEAAAANATVPEAAEDATPASGIETTEAPEPEPSETSSSEDRLPSPASGPLKALARVERLSSEDAARIAPALTALRAVHERLSAPLQR